MILKIKKKINNYEIINGDTIEIKKNNNLNGSMIFFDKIAEFNNFKLSYSFTTTDVNDYLVYLTIVEKNISIEDAIYDMSIVKNSLSMVHIFLKNNNGYIGIDNTKPSRKFNWSLGKVNTLSIEINDYGINQYLIKQTINNTRSNVETYNKVTINNIKDKKILIMLVSPNVMNDSAKTLIKII